MEMPGAPRALREQGRRSFDFFSAGCLKCESNVGRENRECVGCALVRVIYFGA
jgi:hypothetical protein